MVSERKQNTPRQLQGRFLLETPEAAGQPEAGETDPEHPGAHEPLPDDGQSEREMWRKHDRDDPGTDEDADPTVSVRQNLTRNIALNG